MAKKKTTQTRFLSKAPRRATKRKNQVSSSQSSRVAIRSRRNTHIKGDVAGRDHITYNVTQVIQMAAFTPPPDLKKLRKDYLEHLRRSHRALDFKGIPQLESLSRELLLEDVYVPLVARPELPVGETWERRLAG